MFLVAVKSRFRQWFNDVGRLGSYNVASVNNFLTLLDISPKIWNGIQYIGILAFCFFLIINKVCTQVIVQLCTFEHFPVKAGGICQCQDIDIGCLCSIYFLYRPDDSIFTLFDTYGRITAVYYCSIVMAVHNARLIHLWYLWIDVVFVFLRQLF